MANKNDKPKGVRIVNRKAFHDYRVLQKLECGLQLTGTEVKSLRAGQAKIDEAYARISEGELWLVGATISPYPNAPEPLQHDPNRDRKLLVHKRQLAELESQVRQKGKTMVPLALYFRAGWAKCEIGVVEGKRQYDKRQDMRKREHERDMARAMRRRR